MTDHATDLLWEEEPKLPLAAPGRPLPRWAASTQPRSKPAQRRVEALHERLQRTAGNGALLQEAEQAHRLVREAPAHRPKPPLIRSAPTAAGARPPRHDAKPELDQPRVTRSAEPARQPRVTPAHEIAADRLSREAVAAAARAAALAQVLQAFETDPAKACLLELAQLVETAPPAVAEETARALARIALRADPAHRAAIAARIRVAFGDHRDLRLVRLVFDRLAGLAVPPQRAPAPPPPPGP